MSDVEPTIDLVGQLFKRGNEFHEVTGTIIDENGDVAAIVRDVTHLVLDEPENNNLPKITSLDKFVKGEGCEFTPIGHRKHGAYSPETLTLSFALNDKGEPLVRSVKGADGNKPYNLLFRRGHDTEVTVRLDRADLFKFFREA